MKVPFVDLKAEYLELHESIDAAIHEVIDQSHFILSPEVTAFEQAFASFSRATHCVSVANGTEALKLTLEALGVGHGDEVIVPVNTFAATALAVRGVGATPKFVDCDPETFLLDVTQAAAAVNSRTKAIMPVHLYGKLLDVTPLRRFGLPIVEDSAQAHGARQGDIVPGAVGDAACFSFYPSKNLGAYGDGGAVTTNRHDLYDRLLMLRNYGQRQKYVHETAGYNSRLDGLQAAILSVKLKHLEAGNERRRAAAQRYDQQLVIPRPRIAPGDVHHLYVIQVARRDELAKQLKEHGIESGIHYPVPLHQQPCFADLGYATGQFPVAEKLAQQILSLPMFPQITREQLAYVISIVNRLAEPAENSLSR